MRSTRLHKALSRTVKCKHRLLLDRFHSDKSHTRYIARIHARHLVQIRAHNFKQIRYLSVIRQAVVALDQLFPVRRMLLQMIENASIRLETTTAVVQAL